MTARRAPFSLRFFQPRISGQITYKFFNSSALRISSAGISALMGLTHRLRKSAGELVLVHPTDKVYRVFRTLGFTNIFKIVESESELVGLFPG